MRIRQAVRRRWGEHLWHLSCWFIYQRWDDDYPHVVWRMPRGELLFGRVEHNRQMW